MARDPEVVGVARLMPTRLIEPVNVGAQPAAQDAWGIGAVGADVSAFTGDGIVVAVLDSGIDPGHAAFQGVEIIERDFSGSGNGDRSPVGHGTHCAGTIFGRDVNGKRIGVARGVKKALIGKVFTDQGGGDSAMIFRAIQWAADEGAHVISMSLGFDFPGFVDRLVRQRGLPVPLATSIGLEAYRAHVRMFDRLVSMVKAQQAFGHGTVIVAAAGNESERQRNPNFEIAASLPAAADGVIAVGALQRGPNGLTVADFSNTFPQVSAPGVDILSAKVGGGLHSLSGTSMACPHVAGVAALVWDALNKSGTVIPNARTVEARLLALARTNVLAQGVDVADRGDGIVTAP
jgi:subtilisin family serine protease